MLKYAAMASGFKAYPFDTIELKWQAYWQDHKTFRTPDSGEPGSKKPKFYVLDMFPYPSASGLHVGHLEGYTATDIISRYKRMKGFNILHPMGWDAFGLPAEQHALETGTHPRQTTEKNVQNFKRQLQRFGFSYDWEREVNTTDPHYYRWTQWIFMKLYEKGLAYEAEVAVNWCPELGTVLANEEVIDGKSERGGYPVVRKPMRQWVLKITAYAERLLQDLEALEWPEPIKEMQRNWIGKSVGAEVNFKVTFARHAESFDCHPERSEGSQDKLREESSARSFGLRPQDDEEAVIRVFTTRPDTLFGATYMVLAPEHSLVSKITPPEYQKAVESYVAKTVKKSDLERTDLAKEKTGVFTGVYAANPVNQKKIPVWIADYVLISYGSGAIMAVPAHDERDFEFATKFDLPIVEVIRESEIASSPSAPRKDSDSVIASPAGAKQSEAFTGVGICVNSTTPDGSFSIDGMRSDKAKEKITAWLEKKGIGKKSVQYKLRDWLFSRQRYWGEPIPVIHVEGKPKLIPEKELPLKLPETAIYKPTGTGESPLAAIKEWVETKDPETGKVARRETNTMPQWAGSCWYYLAYIDPPSKVGAGLKPAPTPVDLQKEKYWMPVDLYVGGAEHAVLHLLYARFWHKVLYDLGAVSTLEPFQRLVNQGMILGEDGQKMSKSRGNVMNPDTMVERYGADSIRLYEMFMGPLEMTKPWSTQGVEGVYRFLGRAWRLFIDKEGNLQANIQNRQPTAGELKILHQTIKKVSEDIEGIRLNTAISALMVFVNETLNQENYSREVLNTFLLLLAPFAPHLAEELWEKMGHSKTLTYEPWPEYDPQRLIEEEAEMAVLVAGKVRAKMVVSKALNDEEVKERALSLPKVKEWIDGKKLKQVIVVPGRVVNIVVG